MFDSQILQINRMYATGEIKIEITEVSFYNAYCLGAKVKILDSQPHGVTIGISDGRVTWFHRHPFFTQVHYQKAEEAIKKLWELIYKQS